MPLSDLFISLTKGEGTPYMCPLLLNFFNEVTCKRPRSSTSFPASSPYFIIPESSVAIPVRALQLFLLSIRS